MVPNNIEKGKDEGREQASGAPGVEGLEVRGDESQAFDPETADAEALRAKYLELEKQLREVEERALRIAADAENFKKRLEREKEEQTRYANEVLIRGLLPVIDNLERALDHSQVDQNQEGLVEGLRMTLKGFQDTLTRFGCAPVEAVGKVFDPNFHEAVFQEDSEEYAANTVVRELQKGYMLKDRLLRPSMVVVTSSATASANSNQGE